MKEVALNSYKFPSQLFFGEQVSIYAIEQPETIFCFDIPQNSTQNIDFLRNAGKPVRIIMSHGSTANGVERTREVLLQAGVDVQIWLHEADRFNQWLSITPDTLLSGSDKKISEDLTIIFTPGHTAGSVCLLLGIGNGIIFSGDTLGGTPNGDIRPFELKDNDLDSKVFFSSLHKLLTYEFDRILPFHYFPITDGKSKLVRYLKKYDKNKTV